MECKVSGAETISSLPNVTRARVLQRRAPRSRSGLDDMLPALSLEPQKFHAGTERITINGTCSLEDPFALQLGSPVLENLAEPTASRVHRPGDRLGCRAVQMHCIRQVMQCHNLRLVFQTQRCSGQAGCRPEWRAGGAVSDEIHAHG